MPRRKFPPQTRRSFTVGRASVVDNESLLEVLDILGCNKGDDVTVHLQRLFYLAMELRAVRFGARGRPRNYSHKWLVHELRKVFREHSIVLPASDEDDDEPRKPGRQPLPPFRATELDFIREAAKAFGYKLPSGWRRQAIYFDHPEFVRGFDDPTKVREAKFARVVERVRRRRLKGSKD